LTETNEPANPSEPNDAPQPQKPTGDPAAANEPGEKPPPSAEPLDIESWLDRPEGDGTGAGASTPPSSGGGPTQFGTPRFPVSWRELIGVVCLIVLCDVTIYRGEGFAGYALLFIAAPILMGFASSRRCGGAAVWIVAGMLAALSAKLVWCGSAVLVATGFVLTVAFAMALAGYPPYVFEGLLFAAQTLSSGYVGLADYKRWLERKGWGDGLDEELTSGRSFSVLLPLVSLLVFGWIFILANPDLVVSFWEGFELLREWVQRFSPEWPELVFWLAVLWLVTGLLRPIMSKSFFADADKTPQQTSSAPAPLYPAFRNTLVTVIALFAVYLVFEFRTLWFREFEEGFYYSGYAHEGAAWLTTALALATALLSLVFHGKVLNDGRISVLRRLAWIWSLENLVLAAAVYNRLFIYIGFNGMSRMRMVGLFGMTAVAVGFLLVVWKIVHSRSFTWLVRRHLWTLAVAIYLLALTPVDRIVVDYNVRRILTGDPAPSVQISVHPIDSEGILRLQPLLDCDDEAIREGVRAMLAERHQEAKSDAVHQQAKGWTSYQLADRIALEVFEENRQQWEEFTDRAARRETLKRFHEYAYQWY
jgi:hypothetical protein